MACALATVVAACSVPPQQPAPQPEPVRSEPAPPAPEPTAQELAEARRAKLACTSLSIAAVGDLMLGTDYPEPRLPDDDGRAQLAAARPLLSRADIAFGNLEGVLMDGGEPEKQCRNPSACYLFRSPTRFARTFADAGFDVLSLANNHAFDFGEAGRSSTMRALDEAGVRHTGRQGDVASWQIGDVRVAVIAFAPFKRSWPMLDPQLAPAAIRRLAHDHDLVIVSMHGGAEGADAEHIPFSTEWYYGENRGDVVKFAHAMIDAGADLVIGHGPHVPRAMELYRGRLIAYSLGNFVTWWGISVAGPKGFAPLLDIEVDGNGQLLSGRVYSFVQQRPNGPRPDPAQRAATMIRRLTGVDFSGGNLNFDETSAFRPARGLADNCGTKSD